MPRSVGSAKTSLGAPIDEVKGMIPGSRYKKAAWRRVDTKHWKNEELVLYLIRLKKNKMFLIIDKGGIMFKIILIVILLITYDAYGQEILLKKSVLLRNITAKGQVFSSGKRYFEVRKGTRGESVISETGQTYILKENEHVVDIQGPSILTKSVEANKATLHLYKLDENSSMSAIGVTNIETGGNASFLGGGLVILTDEYELFGRYIRFYSDTLTEIKSIRPFEDSGFQNVEYADNNEVILVLAMSKDKQTKLLLFDKANLTLKKESNLYEKIVPNSVKSFDPGFIVYGRSTVSYIDNQGNLVWSKNLLLPRKEIEVFQERLFLITRAGLICLDATTGAIKWQRTISSFYPHTLISNANELPNIEIRPIVMKAIFEKGSKLALVIGQTKKGSINPTYPIYNSELYVFNNNGDVIFKSHLADKSHVIQLETRQNTFSIIKDAVVEIYENIN